MTVPSASAFIMLAAHIENGDRLGEALEKVPSFLPPQVNAMLRAGEKLGDLKKVLPACREVLRIAPDTVRTTMHYMVAILLLFAPIAIFMILLITTVRRSEIQRCCRRHGRPAVADNDFCLCRHDLTLYWFEILLFVALLTVAAFYIGGPGLVRWFQFRSVPVVDWITWRMPWKQKKLLRAFSAMLAVLLDGGVPEAEAVRLAGESTANEICRRRARRVIAALEKGERLDEAVRAFDDTGEFHWRLTNATHAHGGFLNALRWLARGARREGISTGGNRHPCHDQRVGDPERPGRRADRHGDVRHSGCHFERSAGCGMKM